MYQTLQKGTAVPAMLADAKSHERNGQTRHDEINTGTAVTAVQSADQVSLQQLTAAGVTENSDLEDLPSNHAFSGIVQHLGATSIEDRSRSGT
jgi:hypothetical protein